MIPHRAAARWVSIWVVTMLAACAPPPPPLLSGGQRVDARDPRAVAVATAYRDRAGARRALRGSARVVLEGPDYKLNRPQRVAIARPERLRFEVLGLFDVVAAILVSDGVEFGFFEASTGDVRRGVMTDDLLWELAQLDLEARAVVDLLLAAPLPSPRNALLGVWIEPDAGWTFAYATSTTTADGPTGCVTTNERAGASALEPCTDSVEGLRAGGEIFRFDAHGLLRELHAIEAGGSTRYRASFDDYAELPTAAGVGVRGDEEARRFPMRITVESPAVEATARFEWKRIMLTDTLPDRLFRLPTLGTSAGSAGESTGG